MRLQVMSCCCLVVRWQSGLKVGGCAGDDGGGWDVVRNLITKIPDVREGSQGRQGLRGRQGRQGRHGRHKRQERQERQARKAGATNPPHHLMPLPDDLCKRRIMHNTCPSRIQQMGIMQVSRLYCPPIGTARRLRNCATLHLLLSILPNNFKTSQTSINDHDTRKDWHLKTVSLNDPCRRSLQSLKRRSIRTGTLTSSNQLVMRMS